MRRVSISCLKPGMKLGCPIYNSRSDELLVPGVVLTNIYIQRLRDLGIDFVWIDDELLSGVKAKEVVSLNTRIAAIRKIRDAMINAKVTGRLLVHQETFRDIIKDFTGQLVQNKDAMYSLYNIHDSTAKTPIKSSFSGGKQSLCAELTSKG